MEAIQIFENPQFGNIRTAGTADNPLFCLTDVCRVLELQTGATKNRLNQKGISSINTPTNGGNQFLVFINEQNLYKVIMRSDKPQAEPFQDWVCGEVLPSIRKHGAYMTQDTIEHYTKSGTIDKRYRRKSRTNYRDLKGLKFGNLIAIREAGKNEYGNLIWECKCDCGNYRDVPSTKLIQGRVTYCKDCGMKRRGGNLRKHGLLSGGRNPRLFKIWNGIKARCCNRKSINYHRYGGRGIKICDDWSEFINFYKWAINSGYNENLTLDRIDNNGDYTPSNCHWIPWSINIRKQNRYTMLNVKGAELPLGTFANALGISRFSLRRYYNRHGKETTENYIEELSDKSTTTQNLIYFVNKFNELKKNKASMTLW